MTLAYDKSPSTASHARSLIVFVDDNFYDNKKRCRALLEAIVEWRNVRKRPFMQPL